LFNKQALLNEIEEEEDENEGNIKKHKNDDIEA
jgi:hypothetical protein